MGTKLSYTSSATRKDGKAKGIIKSGITLTVYHNNTGKIYLRHIYRKRELYGGGSKKG